MTSKKEDVNFAYNDSLFQQAIINICHSVESIRYKYHDKSTCRLTTRRRTPAVLQANKLCMWRARQAFLDFQVISNAITRIKDVAGFSIDL